VGVVERARARLALLTQHAVRRHIVMCGLSGSTTFFDIISNGANFGGKKVTEHKMCILFSSANLKHFSF
jgi:hypothetical protein